DTPICPFKKGDRTPSGPAAIIQIIVELRRNQAETHVPVAVVGHVPVPVRGAAVPGVVVPAAPAKNARRTSG
ncbi:hypothetical protein MHK_003658, partial [Candidatus Magnetomorum sp. HK-1]